MTTTPPTTDERRDVEFTSDGTRCSAWFYPAQRKGAPVIVMGHGVGGTKDSGLDPYARALRAAGFGVFAFDYRCFGESDGLPRQRVNLRNQVADYHAACEAASRQPGVDPNAIVLWGVSQSGGHVFEVGASRSDVVAVIALVPMVSGLAATRHALPQHTAGSVAKATATGWRSSLRQMRGKEPAMIPIVARPGEFGALTAPGYFEAATACAGPTWRNEIDATIGTQLATYRPARYASKVTAPMLVQIADLDLGAPPQSAAKAAFAARAEVRHYPCDHFDVFAGATDNDWFERCAQHQADFLHRHVGAPTSSSNSK